MICIQLQDNQREDELIATLIKAGIGDMMLELGGGTMDYRKKFKVCPPTDSPAPDKSQSS